MLSNSFSSFFYYFNHFELIDYVAFIWFIILFFLFLTLSILLLRKHVSLALFMVFVLLVLGVMGPFFMKWYLNKALRKTNLQIVNMKQLNFSDTFIMDGKVENLSKRDFSTCRVYIGFYKVSKNKYLKYFDNIKPIKTYAKDLKEPLKMGQSADFRIVLNNFKIAKDMNVSGVSECYK